MYFKSYEGHRIGELRQEVFAKKTYFTFRDNIEINLEFTKGLKVGYCYLMDCEKKECIWEGEVSSELFKNILKDVRLFIEQLSYEI